jgi:hypothetical protein
VALDTTPSMNGDAWSGIGVWKYGMEGALPSGGHASVPHMASTGHPMPRLWSPQHPMFWFAGLLLATGAGLFAMSGSVTVAKTTLSGSVGGS